MEMLSQDSHLKEASNQMELVNLRTGFRKLCSMGILGFAVRSGTHHDWKLSCISASAH